MASKTLLSLLALAGVSSAVNGGVSDHKPTVYTALAGESAAGGSSNLTFSGASYEYTGFGAAESNIDFAPNGDWIYAPAFTTTGNGYALSTDKGATWTQVLPGGNLQPRGQPVFRQADGRYYYWSTVFPGMYMSRSADQGKTWTLIANGHFDPYVSDWAKLIGGKPVRSTLSNGATEILYYSAPSNISTPLPVQPNGPVAQYFLKSADHGVTWTPTAGAPSLQPGPSGGACAGASDQELIIWGDGFVTKNGTIMLGLRRCQALSIAVSDDEGDSWRFVDVPGSHIVSFAFLGILSYVYDGNVLVPEPISMDANGNIFAIWVDIQYGLQMSKSTDFLQTFSTPVIIAAPGPSGNIRTYLPTLRHSATPGRGALAYYGSSDNTTWDGYVAESNNLLAENPTFVSIIGNPTTLPLQANVADPTKPLEANKVDKWDQGYGNLFGDLIEFCDIRYEPSTNNLVVAMTRKMCTAYLAQPASFNVSSCEPGWNFTERAQSAWQGFVITVKH